MSSPYKECPRPVIAVTMGDPCGIGPEILVKALNDDAVRECCLPVVVGDALALRRAVRLLGVDLHVEAISDLSDLRENAPGVLSVLGVEELSPEDIVAGRPTAETCRAILQYIQSAVRLALNGAVHAVCTCPIHKAHLHSHGFSFPGHTEFLQHLTSSGDVVMMLAGPRLRVSLVTIHHPLAKVPTILNQQRISRTIEITARGLMEDFGIESPRMAVAGLNPHGGEEGRFGREEIEMIAPVVEHFREVPFSVSGPYPPDTVFHRAYLGEFDAVVAMYHDQGLIPIKLVHFHEAVNVTLGLPIIRTSVDHGTAYDLAGTGKAHSGSLKAAIRLAAFMAENRRKRLPAKHRQITSSPVVPL